MKDMRLNEVTISRAILEEQHRALIDLLEVDAAVIGGGPSGLTCAALPVSFTHPRAHENVLDLGCRLLL